MLLDRTVGTRAGGGLAAGTRGGQHHGRQSEADLGEHRALRRRWRRQWGLMRTGNGGSRLAQQWFLDFVTGLWRSSLH
jgi:hypothetical protein